MKDTLKIAAEYLYDTELDLQVRTGALYTIYGLYYHQMNRPRIKVRLNLNRFGSIATWAGIANNLTGVRSKGQKSTPVDPLFGDNIEYDGTCFVRPVYSIINKACLLHL